MNNKSKSITALSLLTITLLFTISALPMASIDSEDAETIPNIESAWDDFWGPSDEGTEQAVKWWLRVLPITGTIAGIFDYYDYTHHGRFPVAGNDNAILQYAREVDAQRSAEQQYNLLMVASNLVMVDTQTWQLTSAHLNRVAEIAAAMYWDDNLSYDPNTILKLAGVYDLLSTGNLSTQDILDQAVKVSADLRTEWDSTNYGDSLDIEIVWDGGGTGISTSRLYTDFMTLVTVSNGKNIVYLSQSTDDFASVTNSTVWAYTNTGTITSVIQGSSPISLNLGANDISDLPSGFYVLSPGTYGGPFLSAVSPDSATVTGATGLICDDKYGFATAEEDEVKIFWNGEYRGVSSTLDFRITGDGISSYTSHRSPLSLTLSYGAYVDQLSVLLMESSISAQTMWSITDTAKESNILLSPSSLMPHLSNLGIDAQQSYALYVMALDQIAAYNTIYGEVLKDGMVQISAQSLNLYCHGSVYDQHGNIVLENAVLTPYVYLDDMKVNTGKTLFNQEGLIMVWDIADTLTDWSIPTDTGVYKPMIMPKGAYLILDEIVYGGNEASTVTLEVIKIERIPAFDEILFERSDTPAVLEASTLVMIIVIEMGAIIALIGYIIRMPSLIAAGAIVALVGFFASDWIARLLLGRI
ncbi:MAG TPA: hypothetical protein VJY42_02270 [Candidatus Methanomethylophilaceae archaeon]|nr:hypothetical protein [Candidatus Methanomethylophilaceae archaeon]